ncbi:MAG: hypothetical protein J6E38_06295 [Clostridia bacterium]|nr:hypothetical protein [Clostridia bacterium]
MKKLIALVFALVCILSLVGCNTATQDTKANESWTFQAILVDFYDGFYLVEPLEDSYEGSVANQIEVPIKKLDPSLEPEVGDTIEITHSGVIMEVNLSRLREVYSIKVIEEAE